LRSVLKNREYPPAEIRTIVRQTPINIGYTMYIFSYPYMSLTYYGFGIRQVVLTKRQTVLMVSNKAIIFEKLHLMVSSNYSFFTAFSGFLKTLVFLYWKLTWTFHWSHMNLIVHLRHIIPQIVTAGKNW
jgi:hypothetical protein